MITSISNCPNEAIKGILIKQCQPGENLEMSKLYGHHNKNNSATENAQNVMAPVVLSSLYKKHVEMLRVSVDWEIKNRKKTKYYFDKMVLLLSHFPL